MHENRKNKPNKTIYGGDRVPMKQTFLYPTYVPIYMPKGCGNEIQIYKKCVRETGKADRCLNEKINIMEVCPKWTLELLRERKRNLMRALPLIVARQIDCRSALDRETKTQSNTLARMSVAQLIAARRSMPEQ